MKIGQTRPRLRIFLFSWIRTRIVRVEGERADPHDQVVEEFTSLPEHLSFESRLASYNE